MYRTQSGFTVIELLVTIAIIGILTAVILIRYGSFNSSVLLKSQVYEMALNIREAQVFAVSVRSNGGANQFRRAYGVYFNTSTPNTYRLFLDSEGNSAVVYDTTPSDETVGSPFTIDPRFRITKICVNNCSTNVDNLSVSFMRPDFDAQLAVAGQGIVSDAEIVVAPLSDTGEVRSVRINSAGQISVH